MTIPFDYSNWKSREDRLSRPDLLAMLPVMRIAPRTICIEPLYEEEDEQFALAHVWDVTCGQGPGLGYLILYEHVSTFIYDYDVPFATYEFDYEVPVSILNAIYNDLKENNIGRQAIVSSLRQFVKHRLFLNKWGPGDGYYESPEYTFLNLVDTPLLDKFRYEYPFLLGFSIPKIIGC